MTIDSEQLRQAMRAWTTGVTIVTANHEGKRYGMTVNSFTSISLDPPMITVTLRQKTYTHTLIQKSGEFAITILSANQGNVSDIFAGKIPDVTDRFAGLPTEKLVIDAPLLKGGTAFFNCRVVNSMLIGENTLFIAEVIAAQAGKGEPLVYHDRVYWNLAK